ncbi:MAG: hypothetical protein NDI73_06885 [Desulfuromonadales bacterium]|nr:hypothetical protein [Desulfuromonadales bacterium]
MTSNFLPQFRRQLFDWLNLRVAGGRLPFRRVEETPPITTGKGPMAPDLVLWINRDSLLAGAMILIPEKNNPTLLENGCEAAGSLGLRQFVTWEAQEVNLWETAADPPRLLKSWRMPDSRVISADDFAITFEQLLRELKNLAVSAVLPAEQLPPAYFANLCLQTLHDIEPFLLESARLAAPPGQPDGSISRNARNKGWLTLWRLLTLLQHHRMPTGVRPERLDRALGYALTDLSQEDSRHLAFASDEPQLPESAAIRFHHLAGRLAQLGWCQHPERTASSLGLLFAEAARGYQLETAELSVPPAADELLVNHLPPQPLAGSILVAPQPCLAGWKMTFPPDEAALPTRTYPSVAALSANDRPARIIATIGDPQPLPAAQRRPRLAALRQPWPYRRFQLPGDTPAWLWDALHLIGLADPDGSLQLTLPSSWATAPGAEQLWPLLAERLTLATLQLHADGRQTLMLIGHNQAPDTLTISHPDGSSLQVAPLLEDADLATVAALGATATLTEAPIAPRSRRKHPVLAEQIAARVFRDGLPRFPEDYLRRFDLPGLRTYLLPGPLQINSHFFDRINLAGPDGTTVDSDNPADAEALILASCNGRVRVDLPTDPALTMRLVTAYREDLRRLWQELIDECRRQRPVQKRALALARRLWREQGLPPVTSV